MKEKQIKYLTIGVFVLVVVNIALLALLIWPKSDISRGRGFKDRETNRGARFLANSLDLTPDQQKEFRTIFQEHKTRKDSLSKVIMYHKRLLAEQITQGQTSQAKMDTILDELTKAHRANELELYNHFSELSAICTPEQLKRLRGIIQKHRPPHPGRPQP